MKTILIHKKMVMRYGISDRGTAAVLNTLNTLNNRSTFTSMCASPYSLVSAILL